MTNAQLYLALGMPTLTALTTLIVALINFAKLEARMDRLETKVETSNKELRSDMDKRFSDTDKRLLTIEADLRRFFELYGRHDKAIEVLERDRNK